MNVVSIVNTIQLVPRNWCNNETPFKGAVIRRAHRKRFGLNCSTSESNRSLRFRYGLIQGMVYIVHDTRMHTEVVNITTMSDITLWKLALETELSIRWRGENTAEDHIGAQGSCSERTPQTNHRNGSLNEGSKSLRDYIKDAWRWVIEIAATSFKCLLNGSSAHSHSLTTIRIVPKSVVIWR